MCRSRGGEPVPCASPAAAPVGERAERRVRTRVTALAVALVVAGGTVLAGARPAPAATLGQDDVPDRVLVRVRAGLAPSTVTGRVGGAGTPRRGAAHGGAPGGQ